MTDLDSAESHSDAAPATERARAGERGRTRCPGRSHHEASVVTDPLHDPSCHDTLRLAGQAEVVDRDRRARVVDPDLRVDHGLATVLVLVFVAGLRPLPVR